MDGTTNGLSASDVALLQNSNDGFGGNNSWLWFIVLLFMIFGANGFGGNNGMAAAAAVNGGYVTNSGMNDAFNFAALERQNMKLSQQ